MGAVFRTHSRRVLDQFEEHGAFAEAVERYAEDPALRKRATEVLAAHRRQFVENYGSLMTPERRAYYLEDD
jgi:hypothetical protein